jgi:DNA-directed RNA polymerase specialized sigma24 family protein
LGKELESLIARLNSRQQPQFSDQSTDATPRFFKSLMNKTRTVTPESFNALLEWFDADHSRAGEKYEEIRRRLIKIFTCRGCHEAESLADDTIDRVALKVESLASTYTGDPALYFYAVARKVLLEYLRKKKAPSHPLPQVEQSENKEQEFDCLERCLEKLSRSNCDLVLRYYKAEKRAKIDQRKELALSLGIALNALRIRACRIRATLHECVQHCLEREALG